jgi:hypothetical protein
MSLLKTMHFIGLDIIGHRFCACHAKHVDLMNVARTCRLRHDLLRCGVHELELTISLCGRTGQLLQYGVIMLTCIPSARDTCEHDYSILQQNVPSRVDVPTSSQRCVSLLMLAMKL